MTAAMAYLCGYAKTFPPGAKAFAQTMLQEGSTHDLVKILANWNPALLHEIPTDTTVLAMIAEVERTR